MRTLNDLDSEIVALRICEAGTGTSKLRNAQLQLNLPW
jgi:hypothetical protein